MSPTMRQVTRASVLWSLPFLAGAAYAGGAWATVGRVGALGFGLGGRGDGPEDHLVGPQAAQASDQEVDHAGTRPGRDLVALLPQDPADPLPGAWRDVGAAVDRALPPPVPFQFALQPLQLLGGGAQYSSVLVNLKATAAVHVVRYFVQPLR